MAYTIEQVQQALEKCWSKDTCYPKLQEKWNLQNPSLGQAAITAMIVYDYFGGHIKKCYVEGVEHEYNIIDTEIVDLTKDQFQKPEITYLEPKNKRKSDLLKIKNVKERYLILKERVDQYLKETSFSV